MLPNEPHGECSNLRILDADVYDTIELYAHVMGGIGAGLYWIDGVGYTEYDCPVCVHGIAMSATSTTDICSERNTVSKTLFACNVGIEENDTAVQAINARNGNRRNDRVPFELWRQELCIVRGPHPEPSPDATWPAPNAGRALKRCRDGASTSPEASI